MIGRRLHGSTLTAAIAAALLLKLLILYGLWRAFFAQPQAVHMRMPAAQVAQHLLDAAPVAAPVATPITAAPAAPATPAAASDFPPPSSSSKGER